MPRPAHRRLRAAVLSATVVLTPGLGAAAVGVLGVRTGGTALIGSDVAGTLLALASLALAAVLTWATAAAAVGVLEAWSHGTGGPSAPAPATAGLLARGRGAAVSAGVAALVVAALTAPAAAASAGPGPTAPVVAGELVAGGQADAGPGHLDGPASTVATSATPATSASGPQAPGPDPAGGGSPGSWSALAEGFRAPQGSAVGTAALVTAQSSRATAAPDAEVVVVAGDSLWSIAARHLGPGADAAEVAGAWPAWWEANRSVVGDDPDLLLPGQRLVVPAEHAP